MSFFFAQVYLAAFGMNKAIKPNSREFRKRGSEILRIEALSDAVFAFSVSLLVVSLEVPQTFSEMKLILQGALPFFATVSVLFMFWYQQYVFFRHYAMNDFKTILLNLVYLALILFYVYPLKFLFSLLLYSWTGLNLFPNAVEHGEDILSQNEFPQLVISFSAGYFLIWMTLYLMHALALKQASHLELSPYEILYTKKEKTGALGNALIGILAILLSFSSVEWLPGLVYLFIPVILILNEWRFRKILAGTQSPFLGTHQR
jgi:uncharacterized membrane protein